MSSTIEVRRAHAVDAAAVAALMQDVHTQHANALPDYFQPAATAVSSVEEVGELASRTGHVLLVAMAEASVVGYAHAEVQRVAVSAYKRAATSLHLHAIGVAAEHRSRGVGGLLLAAVRDVAHTLDIGEVTLEVYAFNTTARAFYLREGFTPLRELMVWKDVSR